VSQPEPNEAATAQPQAETPQPVLAPDNLTLREAAGALGSSTTVLRKLIRQGRLPEAERVESFEGRVWAIPLSAIPGIADRLGVAVSVADAIDVREPDVAEVTSGWQADPAPEVAVEPPEINDPTTTSWAIESAGTAVEITDSDVSLAEVLDTALLEQLLGAKAAETQALVTAERQRAVYESLAARQLEVERRFTEEAERSAELARQLRDEAVARAVADARVSELRNQLQREISYSEAERYERRQALAREAEAVADAARTHAALGWWSRKRLKATTGSDDPINEP
jgi:hypothetical protein